MAAAAIAQTDRLASRMTTGPEGRLGAVLADVREAVVRYQIRVWDLNADSYCLKLDGKDPDNRFLSRFRPLRVRKSSSCRQRRPRNLPKEFGLSSVVDKKTNKNAVVFDIGTVRWLRPRAEAEVEGGYYCGSLCMAGGTYHVVWDGRQWNVTGFAVQVQS